MHLRSYSSGGTTKFLTGTWTWTFTYGELWLASQKHVTLLTWLEFHGHYTVAFYVGLLTRC